MKAFKLNNLVFYSAQPAQSVNSYIWRSETQFRMLQFCVNFVCQVGAAVFYSYTVFYNENKERSSLFVCFLATRDTGDG